MGFFGDLWDGVKNVASKVYGGAKNIAGKIASGAASGANFLSGIASKIRNIPVIGDIAQKFVDNNPFLSRIKEKFNQFQDGANLANGLLNGQPPRPSIEDPD